MSFKLEGCFYKQGKRRGVKWNLPRLYNIGLLTLGRPIKPDQWRLAPPCSLRRRSPWNFTPITGTSLWKPCVTTSLPPLAQFVGSWYSRLATQALPWACLIRNFESFDRTWYDLSFFSFQGGEEQTRYCSDHVMLFRSYSLSNISRIDCVFLVHVWDFVNCLPSRVVFLLLATTFWKIPFPPLKCNCWMLYIYVYIYVCIFPSPAHVSWKREPVILTV